MSIYDQIARGVEPIGRDLPAIAGMMENRNFRRKLQEQSEEERKYQRGRTEKADQAAAEAANAKEAYLGAQWVLQSATPKASAEQQFPAAIEELRAAGVEWESLDDDQVRGLAQKLVEHYGPMVGEGPPGPQAPGTLYEIEGEGGPQYATAREAIGKKPYKTPVQGAQGTWGQPFEAIDPLSGKPAMLQSHSLTGKVRRAIVDGAAVGPRPRETADSTAPDSLIFRQAQAYFAGGINPLTGEPVVTESNTPKVQRLAARATRLYRESNGSLSVAEAVNLAANPHLRIDLRQQQARPRQEPQPASAPQVRTGRAAPQAVELPEQARMTLKEGVVTTYNNGQRWRLERGQPTRLPDVQEGERTHDRQTGVWKEWRGGKWVPVPAPTS